MKPAWNAVCRQDPIAVFDRGTAAIGRRKGLISQIRVVRGNIGHIETSLRVGRIDVVSSQQAVSLGPDVANLEHRAVAQIALDREVVLRGVLRAQVGLEFAVKKDWAKQGQVSGGAFCGRDNATERIRSCEFTLIHERSIEKDIGERGTASERRLGAELSQHQFFDRIIEKTPAGANAGLAIAAQDCKAIANTRGKGLVIG